MRDRASFIIGLGLALLGAFLVWQAFSIRMMPSDQLMGPRLFPVVIGAGMALLGLATMFTAVTTAPDPVEEGARFDWRGFAWVTASLPALALLITPAGFVIGETALFTIVARGFGSRRPGRDAAIGLLVALIVYVGFVYGLGLQLPAGDWYDALFGED
jgi:putative tricarboxylic transport membrane protein